MQETRSMVINTHGHDVMMSMEVDDEVVYMQRINTTDKQEVVYPLFLGLVPGAEDEPKCLLRLESVSGEPWQFYGEPG